MSLMTNRLNHWNRLNHRGDDDGEGGGDEGDGGESYDDGAKNVLHDLNTLNQDLNALLDQMQTQVVSADIEKFLFLWTTEV